MFTKAYLTVFLQYVILKELKLFSTTIKIQKMWKEEKEEVILLGQKCKR